MSKVMDDQPTFSLDEGVLDEQELLKLVVAVGQWIGLTWSEVIQLEQVAFLHDVDPDMLRSSDALGHLVEAVEALGQRWDGTGNPSDAAGDRLPLSSRIVTVCHAYLSLVTESVWGPGNAFALSAMRTGAGSRFCPRSVAALVGVVEPWVRTPESLVA